MLHLLASIPSPSRGTIGIGPLQLRAYGLCIAIGMLVAVQLVQRRVEERKGDPNLPGSVAVWALPAGVIGARLYHVATDWHRFEGNWGEAFKIWHGGLGIWGGVALGTAVGCWVVHKRGAGVLVIMDMAAPAIPLAQAIGRVGNYFNQELFGRPTSLPWGLEIDLAHRPTGYESSTTFHPTFLYEALWCLAIVGAVMLLERRLRWKPGQAFCAYVAMYTVGRLYFETLRIDDATKVGGLRINEIVAPTVFALAAAAYVFLGRRDVPPTPTPEHPFEAGEPGADPALKPAVEPQETESALDVPEVVGGAEAAAVAADEPGDLVDTDAVPEPAVFVDSTTGVESQPDVGAAIEGAVDEPDRSVQPARAAVEEPSAGGT